MPKKIGPFPSIEEYFHGVAEHYTRKWIKRRGKGKYYDEPKYPITKEKWLELNKAGKLRGMELRDLPRQYCRPLQFDDVRFVVEYALRNRPVGSPAEHKRLWDILNSSAEGALLLAWFYRQLISRRGNRIVDLIFLEWIEHLEHERMREVKQPHIEPEMSDYKKLLQRRDPDTFKRKAIIEKVRTSKKWQAKDLEAILEILRGPRVGGWKHIVEEAIRNFRGVSGRSAPKRHGIGV
jgi:hypothetical protein